MRSLLKEKKGELSDVMIWLITIFILGIGLFIIAFIVPNITDGLRTAGMNNTAQGSSAINSMESISIHTINNGFLMLFVGLIIGVIISSFLIRTHPIFIFLYIFFLAISILLSFYLGNAYETMSQMSVFAETYGQMTFINLVLSHIAGITLAVGAVSMIIIFAKFSTFGGTQQF